MLKSVLSDYTTFIIEYYHQQLANKLIDIQKEVYQIQREVFDLMYSKGWYPLEPEKSTKDSKSSSRIHNQRITFNVIL